MPPDKGFDEQSNAAKHFHVDLLRDPPPLPVPDAAKQFADAFEAIPVLWSDDMVSYQMTRPRLSTPRGFLPQPPRKRDVAAGGAP